MRKMNISSSACRRAETIIIHRCAIAALSSALADAGERIFTNVYDFTKSARHDQHERCSRVLGRFSRRHEGEVQPGNGAHSPERLILRLRRRSMVPEFVACGFRTGSSSGYTLGLIVVRFAYAART